MLNRKKNRIKDLEARGEQRERALEQAREDASPDADRLQQHLADERATTRRLHADLQQTRATLRLTETQLGEKRQQATQLTAHLNQATTRGDRLRDAWLRSRHRARNHQAELAQQQRVVQWLGFQVFGVVGYDQAQRNRLDLDTIGGDTPAATS